jgi:hypothetical protein
MWTLRALIQKAGWLEFFSHVTAILAEQADKVKRDSDQDKGLVACYQAMRIVTQGYGAQCGEFNYRAHDHFLTDEDRAILDRIYPLIPEQRDESGPTDSLVQGHSGV